MTTYAVKRSLPGITMDQLGAAQKAAIDTCNQLTKEGTEVNIFALIFIQATLLAPVF